MSGEKADWFFGPPLYESRKDMNQGNAALQEVTVSETSTTWTHGFLKVIMHTKTTNGATVRSVKAIDTRPIDKYAQRSQWEGTLEEFVSYVGSLHLLAEQAKTRLASELNVGEEL